MFPVNVKLESASVLSGNGKKIPMDVPAIEEGGFVFVPVRFAAAASGAKILWDAGEKKAVFIVDENIIAMTCCGASYVINGKERELPVDIFLLDGRLMVPYKEVLSALSKPVDSPAASPITSLLEPPAVHAEPAQEAALVKTKKPLHPEKPGWSSWGFGSFTRRIKKLFYDDLFGNSGNKTMGRLFVVSYSIALYLFFARKHAGRAADVGGKNAGGAPSTVPVSDYTSREGADEQPGS